MTASTAASSNSGWPWWLVLINGIAALVLGFLLLISPGQTTFVLIQILGIYWLLSGILSLVMMFIDHSGWGWKLATGILGILAGIYIIQHPLWSFILVPTVLVIVLAIQGIIMGIIQLIHAFRGGGWGPGILGVISMVFGIILLFAPLAAATVLPFLLGIWGIIGGIIAIIFAFRMR
jgi:uncharacterized membrane protein HdeD (DUF308 family)